jgi:macrolide-specific efflux system membrane fusion protein
VKRLLACVLLAGCASGGATSAPGAASNAPAAKKQDAGPADAPVPSKGYVGVIAPAQMMDVAPLAAGRIATVNVRAGDEVKAGDVVAEMDPSSMEEELRAAQADLAAAQASYRSAAVAVEAARHNLSVEKKAFAAGVSPRQNVEKAEVDLKQAIAEADRQAANAASARSRVDTAKDHVGNTKLEAKFDGFVQIRFHDSGATVQPGQAIVRILGKTDLRLRFAVPPERKALAADTKITATVDTVTGTVPAVVRSVSPAVDPASGMFIVEAELTADPSIVSQLRPGLAAWVALP